MGLSIGPTRVWKNIVISIHLDKKKLLNNRKQKKRCNFATVFQGLPRIDDYAKDGGPGTV